MAQDEPSKLLREYMEAHPLDETDPFAEVFRRYEGVERGKQVLRLIRAKFFGYFIPGKERK